MTAPYTARYTAKNAIQRRRSVTLYSSYTAAFLSVTVLYNIQLYSAIQYTAYTPSLSCGEHHFCEIEALNNAVGSHAATLANHANQRPPFSSRFEHFRQISASFIPHLGTNFATIDLSQHLAPKQVLVCLNTWRKVVLVCLQHLAKSGVGTAVSTPPQR